MEVKEGWKNGWKGRRGGEREQWGKEGSRAGGSPVQEEGKEEREGKKYTQYCIKLRFSYKQSFRIQDARCRIQKRNLWRL